MTMLRAVRILVFVAVVLTCIAIFIREGLWIDVRILTAIFLAQPAALAALVLMSLRTRVLAGSHVSLHGAINANALALVAAYLAPFRASDAAKPVYLRAAEGVAMPLGLAVLFFERLTDIACIAAMVGILILAGGDWAGYGTAFLTLFAIAGLGIALMALAVVGQDKIVAWTARLPWRPLRDFVADSILALRQIGEPRKIWPALIFACLTWAASYFIYLAYFWGAGIDGLDFTATLAVFLITTLGLLIAILPAGLGTFEGAMVIGLAAIGIDTAQALLLAIGLRLTTLLLPALVITDLLLRGRLEWRDLRAGAADTQREGR